MVLSGIDLVEIKRIKKSLEKNGFLEKYFGEKEIEELSQKKFRPESVAAAFAAKEAFLKVIGTGLSGALLKEIELLHLSTGAPYLLLSGKAKQKAEDMKLSLSVSITHTSELAQAIVIGETK